MVCKNRGIYGFYCTLWVLITMAPRNRVFAEIFGWVRFLVLIVCFLYKPIPTHEKIFAAREKVAQTPLLP